ncbi:MAG: hypothetical protein HY292_16410 [Planctomycetes bacterium]|nr:hypothetical protein [Planctomycetota bacterium]
MSTALAANSKNAIEALDRKLVRVRVAVAVHEALAWAWRGLLAGAVASAAGSLAHLFLGIAIAAGARLALPLVGTLVGAAWGMRRLPGEDEAATLLDRSLNARDVVVSAVWAKHALSDADSRRARLVSESVDRLRTTRVASVVSLFEARALLLPCAAAIAAAVLVVLELPSASSAEPNTSHEASLSPAVDAMTEAGSGARGLRRELAALAGRPAAPSMIDDARRVRSELKEALNPSALPETLAALGELRGRSEAARRIAERAATDPSVRESTRAALASIANSHSRGSAAARDALARLDSGDEAGVAAALMRVADDVAPLDGVLVRRALDALERWFTATGVSVEPTAPEPVAVPAPGLPAPAGRATRWALEDDAFLEPYFAPNALPRSRR